MNMELPAFVINQDWRSHIIHFLHHSKFHFTSIIKETSFWAIVIAGVVIITVNSIRLGTVYNVDSLPKTYLIVEELQEMSLYFFIIILVFYSGELIWKERDEKVAMLFDVTLLSSFVDLAGKFVGLMMIFVVLFLCLIGSGVIFQTVSGIYDYRLDVYFMGFFIELFPFLILYTFISFFIHVIVNKKFVAYVFVLSFFIANIALELLGFQHDLYKFGGGVLSIYSEMNNYGHFLNSYLWFKSYWFVFCILIFIVTALFSVRSVDLNWSSRWHEARRRLNKTITKFGIVTIVVLAILGGYIFYNTNILNTYWTDTQEKEYRAGYEQTLKQFEYVPQPEIVDIGLFLELYPKSRDYHVEGTYVLTNRHSEALEYVYIQKVIDSEVFLDCLEFDRGFTLNDAYRDYDFYSYKLDDLLLPGDSMVFKFEQSFITNGFHESGSNTAIVGNGTFFDNTVFPSLGYNRKYELRDEEDRKQYGLNSRSSMALRSDLLELSNGRNGSDGRHDQF